MTSLAEFLKKRGFPVFHIPRERPEVTVDQMYLLAKTFAERLFSHPEMSQRLKESKLIFRFVYFDERWGEEEPEITVVCKEEGIEYHLGPCEIQPVLYMRMHGDVAHRFWRKKLNLLTAVARGQIQVRGPLYRALTLLPFASIGFRLYEEVLKELGFTELLSYP